MPARGWCLLTALAVLAVAWGRALPQAAPTDLELAPGNPPLTQSVADTWRRLVEFAFDTTLAKEQADALQQQLVAQWQAADSRARELVLAGKEAWDRIAQAVGPQREVMRLELRGQLVSAAERDPNDAANKLVTALWDARSPVIAPGDPPLRKRSAEALVSLYEWLVSRAIGRQAELTQAERDELLAAITRVYPEAAPGDRALLAHTEELYQWLQAEWEKADAQARARFTSMVGERLGVPRTLLVPAYPGQTETWRHPDGLLSVSYPKDWPVRYAALPEGLRVADWAFAEVAVLGDAPDAAIELAALPTAGALLLTGSVPQTVRERRAGLPDALSGLAAEWLAKSGRAEPLGDNTAGEHSALVAWRQEEKGVTYIVWVSAVELPQPAGEAVVILARAPERLAAEYEPAFSKVIHSLRLGKDEQPAEFASTEKLTRELLGRPVRDQMDLVEGLTTGVH